jgi:methylthioribose-1-phosphate isomerase
VTPNGASIEIEQRSADEVRRIGGTATAPSDVAAWNPAFDVTPAELIDAFITEVGILRPPYAAAISSALGSVDAISSASTNGVSR